jgi:hypothetical protein
MAVNEAQVDAAHRWCDHEVRSGPKEKDISKLLLCVYPHILL